MQTFGSNYMHKKMWTRWNKVDAKIQDKQYNWGFIGEHHCNFTKTYQMSDA